MKEVYAWSGTVKKDCAEEYIKRHTEIWPEMLELFKKAGISNYSIWKTDERIFGVYECRYGVKYADRVKAESEVMSKWNEYMKDILVVDKKAQSGLDKVFYID